MTIMNRPAPDSDTKASERQEPSRGWRGGLTQLRAYANGDSQRNGGRSRFVFLMRVVLPSVAALLIGLVVFLPQFRAHEERFSVGFSKIRVQDLESVTMLNARYYGTDDKNQPFTLTANFAAEENPGSQVYSLDAPKADLTTTDGNWLVLGAEIGLYSKTPQTLDLLGGVTFFHDKGYEIQTSTAHVDLQNGSAAGDDPVKGHGPFGQVDSQGFRLFDRGARIIFTGKTKLVLRPTDTQPAPRTRKP